MHAGTEPLPETGPGSVTREESLYVVYYRIIVKLRVTQDMPTIGTAKDGTSQLLCSLVIHTHVVG